MKKSSAPRAHRLSFESLELRRVLDAQPLITEFMASNTLGMEDRHGNRPDWIEIYNPRDTELDLAGWHLTDRADRLTKWQFPSTTIGANEFIVVFASGKDLRDPNQPLHTNFKLSAGGEFLALVQPDGLTIDSSYNFPAQTSDVSFGLAQPIETERVITPHSQARLFVPTESNGASELGTSWTQTDFDDSEWTGATSSVGYDQTETLAPMIGTDIETEMSKISAGVYVRIPFHLDLPRSVVSLNLKVNYDDGFVAYLNGVPVASRNAPDAIDFDSFATTPHAPNEAEDIDLPRQHLTLGKNILALHGLNFRATSKDFLIKPELTVELPGFARNDDAGRFTLRATPGRPNGEYVYEHAPIDKVDFTPDHGFFSDTVTVQVTSPAPGSTIIYTTDGSVPSLENGVVLPAISDMEANVSTLTIDRTTTLRTVAFKEDHVPSGVTTGTYIFLDDVIRQSSHGRPPEGWPFGPVNGQVLNYGMDRDIVDSPEYGHLIKAALTDIPSISVVTELHHLVDPRTGIYVNALEALADTRSWERPASIELIHPGGQTGFQVDAGIRIRGGASRADNNPKHAFRILFRGQYGAKKLEYPLFGDEGVSEFDNIDLRTAQFVAWNWCIENQPILGFGCEHNTMLRDVFSRDTQRDVGQAYTRSRFYHLYLNSQYWGIYQTQERAEASFAASYFGGDKQGYDVVKEEKAEDVDTVVATDGDIDAWRSLWEAAKAGFSDDESYYRVQGLNFDGNRDPRWPVLLDVDALIDYMLVIFYTGNRDGPINHRGNITANNWYGIRNRDGTEGFRFFVHDAELTLTDMDTNRLGPWPAGETFDQSNPQWIHQQLMQNAEYRLRFADRVQKHMFNDGALTPSASLARLAHRSDQIELAIIAESARWGDTRAVSPYTREDWRAAVDRIINEIIPVRTDIVIEQFRNAVLMDGSAAPLYPNVKAPMFNQHGGKVASGFQLDIVSEGTTYFTLDGSDPRQPQSRQLYAGPVALTGDVTVKARSLVDDQWSALVEASFSVDGRLPGDASGDGRFDSADLVLVFQAGEYEDTISGNSTFEEGDWNGDGDFDSKDLVLAFQAGTYIAVATGDASIFSSRAFFDFKDGDQRKRHQLINREWLHSALEDDDFGSASLD